MEITLRKLDAVLVRWCLVGTHIGIFWSVEPCDILVLVPVNGSRQNLAKVFLLLDPSSPTSVFKTTRDGQWNGHTYIFLVCFYGDGVVLFPAHIEMVVRDVIAGQVVNILCEGNAMVYARIVHAHFLLSCYL